MFGLFKKNRVTDEVVVKLMPPRRGDFAGLRSADGLPQDLYRVAAVQNTMRGRTMQESLVPCRDSVKALVAQIKKRMMDVYYVTARRFVVECRDAEGASMRRTVKIDVGSEAFAAWLQVNVRTPGENVTAQRMAAFLDGRDVPGWLVVENEERLAEGKGASASAVGREALVPGAVVLGQYRVERELGQGGMGKVFLATDTRTTIEARRRVVLKVLRMENAHDARAQAQFKKEADTLADLRNDRIAACYNSFVLGDVSVLVMEYVEGVSLDRFLAERGGTLDEETTRTLLLPIAEALDYVHTKKVYHLDVKPQNIIVRSTPKSGIRTCLLDFGIARQSRIDAMSRYTMSVEGTLQYMSPDQRMGEPPSAAMDVYSLAVTAYECLTGRLPHPHGWRRTDVVEDISPRTPFSQAVMRGVAALPERRPATCVQMVVPERLDGGTPEARVPKGRSEGEAPLKSDDAGGGGFLGGGHVHVEDGARPLDSLGKAVWNYRAMLAQSADRAASSESRRADWMRAQQARLRDLTADLARVDTDALIDFFRGVKEQIAAAKKTPDEFFAATDRLVELRAGLPESGGAILKALYASVAPCEREGKR